MNFPPARTNTQSLLPWRWIIRLIGVIVPRRLRANWRQEWEAELRHREELLAEWDRLDWRARLDLLRRSASAFWDALWLQPKRLEDEMFQDLRYGARMLLKRKGFTAIAVFTLALGIGANTAIFSVVNSVLLNPLPYEQADRLVMVWDNNAELDRWRKGPSPGNYQDLRGAPDIFAASAAWYVTAHTLTGEQDAEQAQCALVTPDFFTTLRVEAARGHVFSAAQTPGVATPEYLPTLGIPLLAGRNFTAQDRADTPAVIIVSESFANKVWPDASAIGKQLMLDYTRGKYAYEVVGVTRDIRYYGLKSQPQAEVFIPHAQNTYLPMNVVVRTAADPLQLVSAARQVARGLDAAQPVSQLNTMEQLIERSIAPDRFALALLGLLALLALALANVGIYSVLSYTVAARTHEIGVRMALGATARDVLRLGLRLGLRLALPGIALGLLAACALTRLMEPLLFGVSATDPLTLGGSALLLALVAWLACYLPARRATKVDPLVALRHE